jgi:hypothetical protein
MRREIKRLNRFQPSLAVLFTTDDKQTPSVGFVLDNARLMHTATKLHHRQEATTATNILHCVVDLFFKLYTKNNALTKSILNTTSDEPIY